LRLVKGLPDQLRADHLATPANEAAMSLMAKGPLACNQDNQWINHARKNRKEHERPRGNQKRIH
jgi:hypothetical protein